MQSRLVVVGAIGAALLVAACGSGAQSTASASPSTPPSPSPAVNGTTIAVASNAKLGQILADGAGKTICLFVADTGSSSTRYTTCAQIWPPVLTSGRPQLATGAMASLFRTTNRSDGKPQ